MVGGLAGESDLGIVSDSYSSGSVTGHQLVGGLIGLNDGTLSDSYSSGSVTGELHVGGLVGYNAGSVSNSFWDVITSGMKESDGGAGKTTSELKMLVSFSGAGWNIVAVASGEHNAAFTWNIVDGQTYPFLSWQSVS